MFLNKVIIVGNLTRDPEVKQLPNGNTTVANVSIATNRVWKDRDGQKQEETEFHNVVFFGRTAEIVQQYLKKGQSVLIEGRLRTSSWDDKETGQKRYKTEIVGDTMQMGPRRDKDGGPIQDTSSYQSGKRSSSSSYDKNEDAGSPPPAGKIDPDDIPF